MRLQILISFIILCLHACLHAAAQDTLPKFQVLNAKGHIIVAFYNPFDNALQVNIERSFDSLHNFTTVHALTEPRTGVVTFRDDKAPNQRMYYRIFIQLSSGYSFTHPDTPVIFVEPPPAVKKIEEKAVATAAPIVTAPPRKPVWVPSTHVFTDDYGNVKVEYPVPLGKRYTLKFFDDQQHLLFGMDSLRDLPLTIDKSNFLHSGWFNFEFYIDGKLEEKNKFLLSKEN